MPSMHVSIDIYWRMKSQKSNVFMGVGKRYDLNALKQHVNIRMILVLTDMPSVHERPLLLAKEQLYHAIVVQDLI